MSTATDIKALKARCTALETRATASETKNRAQDATLSAIAADVASLKARVAALEAGDYAGKIAALREEVDKLTEYIIYNINFPPQVGVSALDYCAGDGETDDRENILAAIAAANGDPVYFPTATYYLATALTVPDGSKLVGSGMTTAWLQGKVVFGSTSTFTDLKIGPASAGVAGLRNVDGSDGSSFTRCHFRGGGDVTGADHQTVTLGYNTDISNATFTDCEFERSLGTARNTVSVTASGTIDTVTFDGCHFGVTNGVASGSGRMMVECWTAHGAENWWKDLTFTDCEFEASYQTQLDFACYGDSTQGDGVHVEGCTFHGAGVGMTSHGFGYGICLEWPANVVITGNTFYCCYEAGVYDSNFGQSYDTAWEISDNEFGWDTAEGGITANRSVINLGGANNVVTGNTIACHYELPYYACVELNGANCTGNTVTGNTFNLNATQDDVGEYSSASGNTIAPNTVNRT